MKIQSLSPVIAQLKVCDKGERPDKFATKQNVFTENINQPMRLNQTEEKTLPLVGQRVLARTPHAYYLYEVPDENIDTSTSMRPYILTVIIVLFLRMDVEKGKIEDTGGSGGSYSIKTQFNSEEQWTKALKFMLTNLKWGLAWVTSQFYNR